ncbi:MAG: LytTR family DNA-binding domain-containing protein [Tannerella sp.]|jgi:two-component system LytT family response regulator|nr:LytTR family DNA-binding domain-containing protein [Tannerella sp.]
MKVIIIEDEIVAAQTLGRMILEIRNDMEIITTLQTVEESIKWFQSNPVPDIVFLDIHLADGSSFEIFKEVRLDCPIIFTTAYNEYALEAFEVNSIDYLLKPINKKRLMQAMNKFGNFSYKKDNSRLIADLVAAIHEKQNHHKTHFLIPHKDKLIPLSVDEIAYITSEYKIARAITFGSQSYSLDYSLDELGRKLDPSQFYRINRQYIIAHKAIKDISIWFTGKLSVNLCVPIPERIIASKARVSDFKSWYTRRLR